jgi:hypothetical protein
LTSSNRAVQGCGQLSPATSCATCAHQSSVPLGPRSRTVAYGASCSALVRAAHGLMRVCPMPQESSACRTRLRGCALAPVCRRCACLQVAVSRRDKANLAPGCNVAKRAVVEGWNPTPTRMPASAGAGGPPRAPHGVRAHAAVLHAVRPGRALGRLHCRPVSDWPAAPGAPIAQPDRFSHVLDSIFKKAIPWEALVKLL